VKLAIIAALSKNRVIGKDGKLPWHVSEDLKRFKRLTTGHPVLMGRKTYEALGRPLPHRRNVVLTSTPIPGAETYRTIPQALDALGDYDLVFITGGGEIYSQLLERVDYWYLTIVNGEFTGDTYFPPYEHLIGSRFKLVREEIHEQCSFLDYEKIPSSADAA
jgi:dihydrofolate reductase